MKRFPGLYVKITVRLVISAVFTTAWFFINEGELSPSMPLTLCGLVCLAVAWFSYLKDDGLVILNRPLTSFKNVLAKNAEERMERAMGAVPRKENEDATPRKDARVSGILAGVITGVALIALSFLFR